MPGGFGLRRRVRRRERGAVAVETALVSLVLVTILAGIIDASMLFRDSLSVASASRAAARTGASEPLAATFATDAAQQAVNALSEVDYTRINKIWVYRADPVTGAPVSGWTCASDCVHFKVNASGALNPEGGSWHNRNACAGTTLDAVGVLVEYSHPSTIGVFFNDQIVSEHAVMQLEPIPSSMACVSS